MHCCYFTSFEITFGAKRAAFRITRQFDGIFFGAKKLAPEVKDNVKNDPGFWFDWERSVDSSPSSFVDGKLCFDWLLDFVFWKNLVGIFWDDYSRNLSLRNNFKFIFPTGTTYLVKFTFYEKAKKFFKKSPTWFDATE